ncbi:hypothetical protein ACM9ER_004605 [Vibrio alginolyticus]
METEVKASFSMKYVLLTLLTTVLVSLVGVFINNVFETKTSRGLLVTSFPELNIIEAVKSPGQEIEAKYYLKDSNMELLTLSRKSFTVKNVSDQGVDNLEVSIAIETKSASLIKEPEITTSPKKIVDGIRVIKGEQSSDTKHQWTISLLNPGEAVTFSYSAFSDEPDAAITWNFVPRKMNWVVKENEAGKNDTALALSRAATGLLTMMFILSFVYVLSLPIYYFQWRNREDFRTQYGSFLRFWNSHRPWKLFS